MTENDQMEHYNARNGATGKTLTNSQFSEGWAVAEIMHDSINKTGRFAEKLGDFAHAYSRTEKFDQLKAETIIRDLYEERYGQLMKETLDELLAQEAKLPETARPEALRQANRIKEIIEKGETKPFYRALDHAGYTLADHLGITETGAKNLMREVYREEYGRELYADGKAWEKEFHQPVRESARQAREAKRNQTRSRARA